MIYYMSSNFHKGHIKYGIALYCLSSSPLSLSHYLLVSISPVSMVSWSVSF